VSWCSAARHSRVAELAAANGLPLEEGFGLVHLATSQVALERFDAATESVAAATAALDRGCEDADPMGTSQVRLRIMIHLLGGRMALGVALAMVAGKRTPLARMSAQLEAAVEEFRAAEDAAKDMFPPDAMLAAAATASLGNCYLLLFDQDAAQEAHDSDMKVCMTSVHH
jgi:hypothetical protein